MPSRYVLTLSLLPKEEARVTEAQKEKLKERKLVTLLTDGWEDILRRSVYGTVAAEVGARPIVLGLSDLTGRRATAENIVDVIELSMKKMSLDASQVIALFTDNPTVMQAVRRQMETKYRHILVCALNLIIF